MMKRSLCVHWMFLLIIVVISLKTSAQSISSPQERLDIRSELMREVGAKNESEFDAKLKEYCVKIKISRVVATAPLPSKLLLRSQADIQRSKQTFLSEPVQPTLATYAVVPRSGSVSEFFMVFGEAPNVAAIRRIRQLNQLLTEKRWSVSKEFQGEEGFNKFVSETPANFIVVIGHNEDGGFIFPDDIAVGLSDMAKICKDNGKRIIILSCKSNRFVTDESALTIDSFITYDEAVNIASRLQAHFASLSLGSKVSNRDVNKLIASMQKGERVRTKGYYIVKGLGAGGAAIGTIWIIEKASEAFADKDKEQQLENPAKRKPEAKNGKQNKQP